MSATPCRSANAVAAGKFIGPTPFGFVRRAGKLHRDERTWPIVRRAFEIAAANSLQAAIAYLREAAPTRTYVRKGQAVTVATEWTLGTVRKMLASRAYLGGVWMWDGPEHDRKRVVNVKGHESIVLPELYAAAQHAPKQRRSNGDYPLSGIAVCGACGGPMVGQCQASTRARSPAVQQVHRLRHHRQRRRGALPRVADREPPDGDFALIFARGDLSAARARRTTIAPWCSRRRSPAITPMTSSASQSGRGSPITTATGRRWGRPDGQAVFGPNPTHDDGTLQHGAEGCEQCRLLAFGYEKRATG